MVEWKSIVRNFYPDLHEAVEAANRELESVKIEDQLSDEFCELCGRQMVIKYGPHGKFLACPGFPDCRNTKPYLEKIGVAARNAAKILSSERRKRVVCTMAVRVHQIAILCHGIVRLDITARNVALI